MKYRKKPIVIEAVQVNYPLGGFFSQEQVATLPAWFYDAMNKLGTEVGRIYRHANGLYCIITLEGLMEISSGDYVIQGIEGEIYPCKPSIFEATYEPA